ncbi:DUF808 domain-containing protein [Rubellimicrobium sp. CFH 75288]|uniref:DUF808 domain-containing protein n=1 Tax=Rubellimicrobium sp. CFH 75288 TaxID=2697034 RepID=UPI00141211C8|nr:DUF808 domain-containing protein [Rubellimicrobium sp. CFH 75288]NAZ36286.1 DUF808 family protein [Rubellimicrobium sp. CFH 75288]
MASGLLALLDDVAAIAKLAAASLDDIGAQTIKVGGKAAGVVIDDAAVTPRYVTGLAAERELAIIWRIARGSLRNKLLILLPAALLLSVFAPWAITPILVVGGLYLCFEGAEKILGKFLHHAEEPGPALAAESAQALEDRRVAGAIRTDLILSAEIMAIALAAIEAPDLATRAAILAAVGIAITVAVYGVVALIVKADDIGAALARGRSRAAAALGRLLVRGMPPLLSALGAVGTVAMLWVGGQIVIHGLAVWGWHAPEDALHALGHAASHAVEGAGGWAATVAGWAAQAAGAAIAGLALGLVIAAALHLVRPKAAH